MIIKAWPIALSTLGVGLGMSVGAAGAIAAPHYSIKDVTACSADAMHLCKDKLPKLDAIESCMRANYARLRPACKARFDLKK